MKTPFTTEQFFQIFENYNSAVFPAQWIILLLGLFSIIFVHSAKDSRNTAIAGWLAALWLWTGIIYHLTFFSSINPAAYAFGALFMLQGVFFLIELFRKKLEFFFDRTARAYIGYFFILFGLVIYPVISYLLEGDLARTISLGLPCPTTIFTFGFLMLTSGKLSKYLLIIPSIWALIGTGAATNFGVYQDYVMLLSAILANVYLWKRRGEA